MFIMLKSPCNVDPLTPHFYINLSRVMPEIPNKKVHNFLYFKWIHIISETHASLRYDP